MFDFSSFSTQIACVNSNNESYSYLDISLIVEDIIKYPASHSLVFVMCSNTIGSLVGYLAFLQADCVSLLLNKDMDRSLLDQLVSTYCPAYLWLPDCHVDNHPDLQKCYSVCGYSLLKYPNVSQRMPNDLALLLTTSGSTGSPKLVRLSKKNLISNAKSIVAYLKITNKERPITSLPMYYSFGLSIINSHLISGATILFTDYSYIQKEFWDFAIEKGFTSFSGVPFTYELLRKIKFWNKRMPTLCTLTQAGGKLNNTLLEYFVVNARSKNIDFYVMYGQTEATARMSYLPCEYALDKLGSIGLAIPGGTFELKNDRGDLINIPNLVGELVYSGDNVSLGYAECLDDLMRGDDNNGVLFTGDLAYFDQDGFYYIAGRKKRFLKLFGNRISLDYTEDLLKKICDECACVGTDNKMIIYVTAVDKSDQIIAFLVSTTKLNRMAFEIRFINEIPRSDTGKILYSELSVI